MKSATYDVGKIKLGTTVPAGASAAMIEVKYDDSGYLNRGGTPTDAVDSERECSMAAPLDAKRLVSDGRQFIARLRQGDQAAYRALLQRLHGMLVRSAAVIIGSHAQAEEVVQDAWLAVYGGIGRFEERSSLTTWIFSIVMNKAYTRATHERRFVGLDGLIERPARSGHGGRPGDFKPTAQCDNSQWLKNDLSPEREVAGRRLLDRTRAAIETLPTRQRAVMLLRVLEGRDADETCEQLGISSENQRVLLHRARRRIQHEINTAAGCQMDRRQMALKTSTIRRRTNVLAPMSSRL
jgi:RNA polymerase sigma-70 factor (ECF subfamily)